MEEHRLPGQQPGVTKWQTLLNSLAEFYIKGKTIDWKAFDAPYSRQKVVLPTYPFQRQHYWAKEAYPFSGSNEECIQNSNSLEGSHFLLQKRLYSPTFNGFAFESIIDETFPLCIQDHKIYELTVVAAATYISAILSAAQTIFGKGEYALEDVDFLNPLVILSKQKHIVQIVIYNEEQGRNGFEIFSRPKDTRPVEVRWTQHVKGFLRNEASLPAEKVDLESVIKRCPVNFQSDDYYQRIEDLNIRLGPSFRWIERLYVGENETLAKMFGKLTGENFPTLILSDGFLDSCFQTLWAQVFKNEVRNPLLAIPLRIGKIIYNEQLGPPCWVYINDRPSVTPESNLPVQALPTVHTASMTLLNDKGQVVGQIIDFVTRPVTHEALLKSISLSKSMIQNFYETLWIPQPLSPSVAKINLKGTWLILSDSEGLGKRLAEQFEAKGCNCILVSPGETFKQLLSNQYRINLNNPNDVTAVIEKISVETPLEGVLHLLSVGSPLEQDSGIKISINDLNDSKIESHGVLSLLFLIQSLQKARLNPTICLVTQAIQPINNSSIFLQQTPLNGFFKTLQLEHSEIPLCHIDLEPSYQIDQAVLRIIDELESDEKEEQVAYHKEIRYVPRLMTLEKGKEAKKSLIIPDSLAFRLTTSSKGSLDNLYLKSVEWPEEIDAIKLASHEIAIDVKAAGLNFRDVLNARGLYPDETLGLGSECAGIVIAVGKNVTQFKPGDRVTGFSMDAGFCNRLISSEVLFVPIPPSLSFEEAAAIPIVFGTAYYSLHQLAHLKAGEKVLIHAASGGVGLAAIQIAKQIGAEIYATAGSERKQAYLRSLGIAHIYSSRTLDFGEAILRDTEGHGVDVVLNSLSGEGFIAQSVKACHDKGRFVEISKLNIWTPEQMKRERPDLAYLIFPFDQLLVQNPTEVQKILKTVVSEFKALPYTSFDLTQAIEAFTYLQQAKQIGKVVLSIPQNIQIDQGGSYLITGGWGGLGIKFSQWLADKGCKHLVMTGRHAPQGEALASIEALRGSGVVVEVVLTDVSDHKAVEELFRNFGHSWPILKGIIHSAGILEDGALTALDKPQFNKVFAPKVAGGWNLHQASLPFALDFFVLFSSIASVLGSPGQANYAAANAFLDSLAIWRQSKGLPALSVSWGPWAETGMAADLTKRHVGKGITPFKPQQGVEALEYALKLKKSHLLVAQVDWNQVLKQLTHPLIWLSQLVKTPPTTEVALTLLSDLKNAIPLQRIEIFSTYLRKVASSILGLSSNRMLQDHENFFDLGMDSLMAVEFKNQLQKELGPTYTLSPTILFDYTSINSLTAYLLTLLFPSESRMEKNLLDKPNERTSSSHQVEDEVANMSFEEINKLLEDI